MGLTGVPGGRGGRVVSPAGTDSQDCRVRVDWQLPLTAHGASAPQRAGSVSWRAEDGQGRRGDADGVHTPCLPGPACP